MSRRLAEVVRPLHLPLNQLAMISSPPFGLIPPAAASLRVLWGLPNETRLPLGEFERRIAELCARRQLTAMLFP